jgi:hypothetical protein
LAIVIFLSGCAYHLGLSQRALPGGYSQVSIPMFKNKSSEVGIEPLFTNAMIRRFERSQAAHVVDSENSPVILEGEIDKVETIPGAQVASGPNFLALPTDAVLTTDYRLRVLAIITLRRKSDEKVIWRGNFTTEKVYSAPHIGMSVVNSADATYNQSARMQALGLLAEDMMLEAHDRITENY